MKIAFLTGSVERGRDGVGDYTRHLAIECAKRGIPVVVVSLADRYVTQTVREEWHGIRVVRLQYHARWSERIAEACSVLREFQPSWVSLQFVQYSYQRWGIPLSLARRIAQLVGTACLDTTFHEIWIGPDGSWRRQMISTAQRRIVLALAGRSDVVHTTNECYRQLLGSHGVAARILPLFGNVPIASPADTSWVVSTLAASGCRSLELHRGEWWVVTLFGTIHPEWPAAPLLPRLIQAAQDAGKQLSIVSIGRLGAGDALWRAMTQVYGGQATFIRLGEQSEDRIAALLLSADFGIATSPFSLLGKSGTAAAMFEFGLPIIVNRDDGVTSFAGGLDERRRALIIRLDQNFEERLHTVRRRPPQNGVPDCASQWLNGLRSVPC